MRYIDADLIRYDEDIPGVFIASKTRINNIPTADVVEIGKPYFYEEGYVLKDFHNDGVHRYFVIERAEE